MAKRAPFIAAALVVLLLLGGAVAVYAYDGGRADQIAKGVTVAGVEDQIARGATCAGVEVGGMNRDAATRLLQQRLNARISRPIVVRANHRRLRMSAARAHVSTDVRGVVAEAVDASRQGSILERTWRGLTGGEVNKHVALRLTYSKDAVNTLVRRVQRATTRAPKDADIQASASGLNQTPSQRGI